MVSSSSLSADVAGANGAAYCAGFQGGSVGNGATPDDAEAGSKDRGNDGGSSPSVKRLSILRNDSSVRSPPSLVPELNGLQRHLLSGFSPALNGGTPRTRADLHWKIEPPETMHRNEIANSAATLVDDSRESKGEGNAKSAELSAGLATLSVDNDGDYVDSELNTPLGSPYHRHLLSTAWKDDNWVYSGGSLGCPQDTQNLSDHHDYRAFPHAAPENYRLPGTQQPPANSNGYVCIVKSNKPVVIAVPLDDGFLPRPATPSSRIASAKTFAARLYQRSLPPLLSWRADSIKFVAFCLLWYTSSAITNNIGKQILNQFNYPVTLTYVQFGFVAGMCFLFSLAPGSISGFSPSTPAASSGVPSPSNRQSGAMQRYSRLARLKLPRSSLRYPSRAVIMQTLPLSFFQIAGHVFSTVAISRVPVSFVHTVKALSPLFTVLIYRVLYRVSYSSQVYIALLPLTMGVMLACSFEFNVDLLGSVCALGSCIIFVSQNIFSKKLLFNAVKPVSADAVGNSEGGINGAANRRPYGGSHDHYSKASMAAGFGSSSSSSLSTAASAYTNINDRAGLSRTHHSSSNDLCASSNWGTAAAGPDGYQGPEQRSINSHISTTASLASVAVQAEAGEQHLDKMNLLFYSSSVAFVLMFPLWMYSDGLCFLSHTPLEGTSTSVGDAQPQEPPGDARLISLFFLNGVTHFFQNFFAFSLLSLISPVTYSIASLLKRIFVIVASIVYFRQTVMPIQELGILLTFAGLWMYHSAKRKETVTAPRDEERKDSAVVCQSPSVSARWTHKEENT